MSDFATLAALAQAQELLARAEMQVQDAVREICPEHKPVQRRDRKQPWCKSCGRDALGYPVRFQPIGDRR